MVKPPLKHVSTISSASLSFLGPEDTVTAGEAEDDMEVDTRTRTTHPTRSPCSKSRTRRIGNGIGRDQRHHNERNYATATKQPVQSS